MPYQVLPTPQAADAGLVQFENNWPGATLARKILAGGALCHHAWPVLAAPSRQQAQKKRARETARAPGSCPSFEAN
jgi:hypothetical protein